MFFITKLILNKIKVSSDDKVGIVWNPSAQTYVLSHFKHSRDLNYTIKKISRTTVQSLYNSNENKSIHLLFIIIWERLF